MKTIRHTVDSLKLAHFAAKLAGWHSYAKDKQTGRAVDRCELLGVIEVSRETRQFRPVPAKPVSYPLAVLRHHVTGTIERGEGVAIVEKRA